MCHRFNFVCAPLELTGKCEQFVDSVQYLAVRIVTGHCFKCSFEEVKMKFFRVFNSTHEAKQLTQKLLQLN